MKFSGIATNKGSNVVTHSYFFVIWLIKANVFAFLLLLIHVCGINNSETNEFKKHQLKLISNIQCFPFICGVKCSDLYSFTYSEIKFHT